MNLTSYRRRTGALLGAVLGLGYGLVSQLVNRILLPGIPLYQPPVGFLGNIALWVLACGLLGWLSASSEESIRSVFLSSVAAALAIAVITLVSDKQESDLLFKRILSLAVLMVPLSAFLVPFIGIHRWAVNREVEFKLTHAPLLRRLVLPVIMVMVVSATGLVSLHSSAARVQISRMHSMLRAGLDARQEADLPAPLQEELVAGFLTRSSQHYQLEWDNKNTTRYRIPRRTSSRGWEEAAVIAHFDNRWDLVCIYPDAQTEPSCGSFGGD